jgi:signal peptidase I
MSETGEKASGAVFCRGESMRPLLRPGDRIVFAPCRVEELRRGDVIIFVPPGQKERVVHRVVSTGLPDGIRTKGDANPCRDTGDLRQEDIIGRAVSVERGGRAIPVAGGLAGRLLAALIRVFRTSDHLASHVLNPCYRGLARSGLFRALLPPALRPRVITFERDGQREMQLALGRRIIGRRPAGAGSWIIRRPFRIFVDEQALPCAEQSFRKEGTYPVRQT